MMYAFVFIRYALDPLYGLIFSDTTSGASTYLVPVVSAGLAAALVAVLTKIMGKRTDEADITQKVTDAATGMMTKIAEDNDRLRKQVAGLARDNRELKRRYNKVATDLRDLREALQESGLDPDKRPLGVKDV